MRSRSRRCTWASITSRACCGPGYRLCWIVFATAFAYSLLVLTLTALFAVAGRVVWAHGLRHALLDAVVAAAVTPLVFGFLSWEQRVLRVGA